MSTDIDISPFMDDLAVATDLSLRLRVPLVRSWSTRWNYITAVCVRSEPWVEGEMPNDDELRAIGSFHEAYLSYWYGPPGTGWRARDLEKRPFDVDGGANGVTFIKYPHGGWGYRRRTWALGPTFVPPRGDSVCRWAAGTSRPTPEDIALPGGRRPVGDVHGAVRVDGVRGGVPVMTTASQAPGAAAAAAAKTTAAPGPKRALTPAHAMALHAIQDGHVVCHPAGSHHVPGWGWVEGGDMSLSVQAVLSELHSFRLLVIDTYGRWHVDGDPVGLTGAGRIVLDRIGGA